MAVHYNPAGLASLVGHHLYSGFNLDFAPLSFTRADADGAPMDNVRDFSAPTFGGSLAWSWAPADRSMAFGFAVYGPASHGQRRYPRDGPQRFAMTQLDVVSLFVSAAAAWRPTDWLSLGVTFEYAMLPQQRYELFVDATTLPGATEEADGIHLARATFDLADYASFSAIVGVTVRPVCWLELGASSRVVPVYFNAHGDVALSYPNPGTADLVERGHLGLVDDDGDPDHGARSRSVLPPWVRFGARFVHPRFDIEVDAVWEAWHLLDAYRVSIDGKLRQPFGAAPAAVEPVALPRGWRDTWSVRVGSDVEVVEDLITLRGGIGWESAAAPLATTDLDFAAFERVRVAFGSTVQLDQVSLSLAYQFTWQPDRVVPVGGSDLHIQRPFSSKPGHEVGAGTYQSAFHTLSAGMQVAL